MIKIQGVGVEFQPKSIRGQEVTADLISIQLTDGSKLSITADDYLADEVSVKDTLATLINKKVDNIIFYIKDGKFDVENGGLELT